MTHKVIHPESISKMHHIAGILTDHIVTSKLDTIKIKVPGEGGMKSTGPRLKLYETFLYLKYDHINWGFMVPVLLYISNNKNRKYRW